MAGFLSRLLGKAEPSGAAAAKAAAGAKEAETPAASLESPDRAPGDGAEPAGAAAADPTRSFICREPLLGRNERIAGYQFSLPEEIEQRLQSDLEFLPKIYDDALLRNLTLAGEDALLGPRLSLVRLSPNSLDNPRIRELPRENTVLMLAPVHLALDAERIRRQLDVLRQAGFVHGWLLRQAQVVALPQLLDLAAGADYVQIDATGFNGMDVKLMLKSLVETRPAELPKLRLIAGGLDALDEFHLYFQWGFELFLGEFVTRRENWHPPRSNINRLRVIKLLNLLRSDAEVGEIAEQLKLDPVLAFKLLRYINSPVMGLSRSVSGLDKALMLLGREKFYRWLSLMLFDFKTPGYTERVLTEQALSRAHFLESLAAQGNLPAPADSLFMLGLFSLLDLLMGQTMTDLLQQARLPDPVRDALLGQPGSYRDALLLAIAAEGQSPQEMERMAAQCGLEPLQVTQCALHSLAWAHEISSLDGA